MRFFPHDENFRQLRLYADVSDRRLTYQQGAHRERIYDYRLPGKNYIDTNGLGKMDDTHPLTSIFNYITDDRFKDGSPLPEQIDYRRTVYWNPGVTTGADGRATVSFCNNGFSIRLAVSAEGLTPGGRAILAE